MATTNIYLNFTNQSEAALEFYRGIFGVEFNGPIHRMGDGPAEMASKVPEEAKNLVMHAEIILPGGLRLMATDAPEGMGFALTQGNNVSISLHPDSREQADEWFTKLSEWATVDMPIQEVFWGAYYGSLRDKFGIHWMVNFES